MGQSTMRRERGIGGGGGEGEGEGEERRGDGREISKIRGYPLR